MYADRNAYLFFFVNKYIFKSDMNEKFFIQVIQESQVLFKIIK